MTMHKMEDTFDTTVQATMQAYNATILPSEDVIFRTRQRMAQAKPRSKWVPRLQRSVAVVACMVLLFVGAVNGSPAFASVAADVPIVRELVKAVAFDPSLKAAIAHKYVQLVKQSATDNGYTIAVEYLVADQRNLTVYYKMDELANVNMQQGKQYRFAFKLLDAEGNELKNCGASWDYPLSEEERESLCAVKFHFTGEATMPEHVQLRLTVDQAQPRSEVEQKKLEASKELSGTAGIIAEFEEPEQKYQQVANLVVPLTIDQANLFNVRTLELHQTVSLDGQSVIFDKVEIYPTQVRVFWHEAETNTKVLSGLQLELQSKTHQQRKWDGISNGVSGVGTIGTPRETWLESNWFSEEDKYQLAITQYAWISKEQQTVAYNYATNTFTNLPDYIQLVEAVPCDTGLYLHFNIESTTDVVYGNVLEHTSIHQTGSGSLFDAQDREHGKYQFYNMFVISDVAYEIEPIVFQLTWAPPVLLDTPIIVPIT